MSRSRASEGGQSDARERRRGSRGEGGRSERQRKGEKAETRTAHNTRGGRPRTDKGRAETRGQGRGRQDGGERRDRRLSDVRREFRSGAIGAESATSGPSERSPVPARQGLRVGSYRFQTFPSLQWDAKRRTLAKMNLRHRMNSLVVTAHAGVVARTKRIVLLSSNFHMCRSPECDRILLNWSPLIRLVGNQRPSESLAGEPHVSRRCAMQSCSSSE